MSEVLRLGPLHSELPGTFQVDVTLDGGFIDEASVRTGFATKGLERMFETRPWERLTPLASRIDSECSIFGELVLCLAIERLAAIEVPERAQYVRIILGEFGRIATHLKTIAEIALRSGAEAVFHFSLRDRERILDLFELVCGARFNLNVVRVGGLASDLTEGFLERALDVCKLIQVRIKEYNDLMTFNSHFLRRSRGVGRLGREEALAVGITGPNARASGLAFDVRKDLPYSSYDQVDFVPTTSEAGDAHARTVLRLREMEASVQIILQCVDAIPAGPVWATKGQGKLVVPRGQAYVRVESPRGLLGCSVVSSGGPTPERVQLRPASQAGFESIPIVLRESREEDMGLILASLGLSVAEADR